MKLELAIAWRYLRSRRGSKLLSLVSLIAILGVTVAVSALIVTMGVMNGMRNDLLAKILIAAPDVYVITYGEDMVMTGWQEALAKIQRQKGVVAAGPFVETQALVRGRSFHSVDLAFIKGIPPGGEGVADVTSIRQRATTGDFTFATPDGKGRGAVVGSKLAERDGLKPGIDSITLITINPNRIDPATGFPVPHSATFTVTGIFDTGLYEYDNSYVFLPLEAAQQLAGLDQAVTGIQVRAESREAAPALAERLQDSIGPRYLTRDWHEQNNALFTSLALEKLGMSVSLLLISVVAAFNIISTLVMVVTDKTKEIGILRAMGMSARSIRLVFFAQGMVIGVVGTGLGLAIGLVVAALIGREKLISLDPSIYFIDHLPVATQPLDVILIVLASVGIAALATIYPARRAAKLLPVEAIRHE